MAGEGARLMETPCDKQGGTNLVAMEALASGVPTILSYNSGHRDIANESYCFPLYRQARPAPMRYPPQVRGYEGWGETDVDELVEQLEFVYHHREEAARRAALAQQAMKVGAPSPPPIRLL